MSWAAAAIAELQKGNQATVKPRGNSMLPRIRSGQTVSLRPMGEMGAAVDAVVLCRVKGRIYLHKVLARVGQRYLIGNNRGGTNGWVTAGAIYGIADI